MPEVNYKTNLNLSPEQIWEFVKDMDNWAPFLSGYQEHEIIDEIDSIWTLKGDVGVLKRVVKLKAHVTEWNGPEKVAFTLNGINEAVTGGGCLELVKEGAPVDEQQESSSGENKKKGIFSRFFYWLFRKMFRRIHGEGPKRLSQANFDSDIISQLKFTLKMEAQGPTGPLVNAMLGPAMLPAAEDLVNKIAAHLEDIHGLSEIKKAS